MHDSEGTPRPGGSSPFAAGEAGVWRAFDASANRAAEALRVVEDVVRFVLDDGELTAAAKNLRHDLAATLTVGPLVFRAALRNVAGDVGVGLDATTPLRRTSATDLLAANAARATQALRGLEECAMVVAPAAAAAFARLRYRAYELERCVLTVARARDRLAGITLCVLVDGRGGPDAFERLVTSLFEAGVRMVQIRDKQLPAAELADRVRRAVARAGEYDLARRPLVVVNDRADVAAAVGADGVHTGADDLPPPLARRVLGPVALVGRTAHDIGEARAAVVSGADYLGIGPCFPSRTKAFGGFAAPEFLRSVAGEIALPVFAIGGIDAARLETLVTLGITRVAVASAITAAPDPAAAARSISERLATLAARGTTHS